jgi:signal transduction histidine kinase
VAAVTTRRATFGRVLLRLLPLVAIIAAGIGLQIYVLFDLARDGLRHLGLAEDIVQAYERYFGQISLSVFLASTFLVVAIAGLMALRETMRRLEDEQRAQGRRLETLEELDRVKDQVLNIVSHELRTPLSFVMGYSELLAERELEPSAMRAMASELHGGARRLSDTVQKLLRASELRLAARPVEAEQLDLRPLLGEAMATWSANCPGGLTLDLEPDLPAVLADREYVSQALGNLLSNAVKYAPRGTPICVQVRATDRRVCVEVSDHGAGIPEEEQDKLFVPFGRTTLSERRCEPGSGLGLFITRRLVELQGGRVWVRSAPGGGSTFGFDLPIARAEAFGRRRAQVQSLAS